MATGGEELYGGDEPLFCSWWPPSWLSLPPSLSWTFVEPLHNLFSPLGLEWSFKAKRNHITSLWWVGMHANFLHSSAGKESTCDAGDSGSISGLGRSAWEGIGYPLQYSWASLVAPMVKNLLAMHKTWVWSLSWEDPLEKGKAIHSSILAWRIPWTV